MKEVHILSGQYRLGNLFLILISSMLFFFANPAFCDSYYVALISPSTETQISELFTLGIDIINQIDNKITVIITDDQLTYLLRKGYSIVVIKEYSSFTHHGNPPPLQNSIILDNGKVGIQIKDNGVFTMWRAIDNKWLLYPSAGTGYFSVNVNGKVYDNRINNNLIITSPLTKIDENTASIVYETDSDIQVIQMFKMEGESIGLYVIIINNSSSKRNVKIRYLLDTQIDENDGSPLYAPSVGTRTYETDIPNVNFTTWEAWLTPENPAMKGIGTISNVPARMIFAWWPNAFGYSWDYTPNPNQKFYTPGYTSSPNSDSCVLLYFDFGEVPPYSCTLPIKTYYGIETPAVGSLSDQLKEAIYNLYIATSDYIKENALLYASSVASGYKELIEDMTIKSLSIDLIKDLLSGDISRIVGKFASKGAIKGSKKAVEILLKNMIDIGLTDVFPGLMAKHFETLDPSWSEDRIAQEITNRLWSTDGWNFRNDLYGINSLLNYLYQKYISTIDNIPEILPENYPIEETLKTLHNIINTIRNHTPFNKQLTSEGKINWRLLGSCNIEISPFNTLIIGTSSNAIKSYKAAINNLKTQGIISELRTYTCIGWTIGLGGVKVVVALTGPGEIPLEALYWSGIGKCDAIGTTMTFVELGTKLAVLYELWDVEGKIASDILTIKEYYTNILENVTLSTMQSDLYSCSYKTNVEDVKIPNLSLGFFDIIGSGTAYVKVRNSDNMKNAKALVLLEIIPRISNTPIGLFFSEVYNINPGSSQDIPIKFSVPNTSYFFTDRYNAIFTVLTSGDIFTRTTSFNVCSTISCFFDITKEINNGFLESSQSAVTNITTQVSDKNIEFILAFPGSDFDLHVYDKEGNHVGMNYQTGQVEVNIKGASYSGPSSNPEIITIRSPSAQEFQVKVVAVQTFGRESFSISMIQEQDRVATLSVVPYEITINTEIPSNAFTQITLGEISNQYNLTEINAFLTDLTGPNGSKIRLENITINCPSNSIQAGNAISCMINFNIPYNLSPGEYNGELTFVSSANSITIPIRVNLNRFATPGDLDGDGDIDQNDLNILLSYRNKPASACPDCDLDGDGMITVLDARKLVLLCTRPKCATQ